MENKQREQTLKGLNPNELEKVNGGIVVPDKPDEHDNDEDSNDSSGGATGGW